jgi:hypothetical protein
VHFSGFCADALRYVTRLDDRTEMVLIGHVIEESLSIVERLAKDG